MKKLITIFGITSLIGTVSITGVNSYINEKTFSTSTQKNNFNENNVIEIKQIKENISNINLYKNYKGEILYTTWTGDGYGRIYQINNNSKKEQLIAKLNGEILSLIVDKNGIIYAGTTGTGTGYGFLYQVYENSFTKISEINRIVLSLATDKDGNVYAGDDNGSIYKKQYNQKNFKLIMPSSGEIYSLTVDSNNNVYAGIAYHNETRNSKIFKSIDGINFYEIQNMINNEIRNLNIDKDGNIYASFLNGNVYQYSFKKRKFIKIIEINDKIQDLIIDKDNNVYIITWKGKLYYKVFNENKINIFNIIGEIYSLIIDDNNNIYAIIANDQTFKIIKVKNN